MTTKDFAIGVLSVTAVILFTGLVLLHTMLPQQAMAIGQNASSGDYLVTTSQLDDTAELVCVVDAALQRMNVYGFNPQAGQIELIQQIDLQPLQRLGQPERRQR